MKRFLLSVFAVLLFCTGCSGGTAKLGKSTPEKLFKMSAVELSELSSSKFKKILNEDGALYEEEYDICSVKTLDKFMGYDCLYAAEEMDGGLFGEGSLDLMFYLDLGTGDEYKEARKKIEGYLEKSQVKWVNAIKVESASIYVLEASNAGKSFGKRIDAEFSDLSDSEFENIKWATAEYFDEDELEKLTKENFADKLKKTLSKDEYKLCKFVQVAYDLATNIDESSYKGDFDGVCCGLYLTYNIFTEQEYLQFAAQNGFDAIDGKVIDLDDVDKQLRSAASDRELYGYYMMKEHGFDMDTGKTNEDKQAFQYWCLSELNWDDEAGENVDLSDYFSSAKVYMAAEENYNIDSGKAFGSEKELAQWLYENIRGNDKDKRMWVLGKTGYDAEAEKTIDKGVAEALYGYYKYLAGNKSLSDSDVFLFIYINDDNIPELVHYNNGGESWNIKYIDILTYHDGQVSVVNGEWLSYIERSNSVKVDYLSANGRTATINVYKIEDGQFVNVFYGNEYVSGEYDINNKDVNEAEYLSALNEVFDINSQELINVVTWDDALINDDAYIRGDRFSNDFVAAYYDSLLPIKRGKQSVPETASPETQASAQPSAQESVQSSGDYILPDSSSRYLTENEIRALSKDEMRLARNEVYARHGRKFSAEDLQAYFNSKSWYSGTVEPNNFDESVLNEYEKANLDLIRAVEGN